MNPKDDPLFRVRQVDRDRALDAVLVEVRNNAQIEAHVQLTNFGLHPAIKKYFGDLADERVLHKVNTMIYDLIRQWVITKTEKGVLGLSVDDFVYEVYLADEDGHKVPRFRYPPVYKELEQRTFKTPLWLMDRYTLHAMAKHWLDLEEYNNRKAAQWAGDEDNRVYVFKGANPLQTLVVTDGGDKRAHITIEGVDDVVAIDQTTASDLVDRLMTFVNTGKLPIPE